MILPSPNIHYLNLIFLPHTMTVKTWVERIDSKLISWVTQVYLYLIISDLEFNSVGPNSVKNNPKWEYISLAP